MPQDDRRGRRTGRRRRACRACRSVPYKVMAALARGRGKGEEEEVVKTFRSSEQGYAVDLAEMDPGDYNVVIEFWHEPRSGDVRSTLSNIGAYVSLRNSNLLLYAFLGMAALTVILFLYYFWARAT